MDVRAYYRRHRRYQCGEAEAATIDHTKIYDK